MNRKKYLIIAIMTILAGMIFLWITGLISSKEAQAPEINHPKTAPGSIATPEAINSPQQQMTQSQVPLDRAKERVTKKPFGIFITSQNSPVQPEKFSGYHTGTDFEVFPEELNEDVSVRAICQGDIEVKRMASGYGGVLVESCVLDSQPVMVVYGHLKLNSISKKVGDSLEVGEAIGILGADKSAETDGERKHLHLGIHKGSDANILGYVQIKNALNDWIDPCSYLCE